ncbi:hypothetical protein BHE74_00055484 [Ensete ventricosum]|nr:hypothetical protein BHE74_00055484 [Ensete ventricosum]
MNKKMKSSSFKLGNTFKCLLIWAEKHTHTHKMVKKKGLSGDTGYKRARERYMKKEKKGLSFKKGNTCRWLLTWAEKEREREMMMKK